MFTDLENHTPEDIAAGFTAETGGDTLRYRCLFCGELFEEGQVYPADGRWFTARRAAGQHVDAQHPDRLALLLDGPGKYIPLTDHQRLLLRLLAAGHTDAEVAARTGAAAATVRKQRFVFREKAKQARMFLALYELAGLDKRAAGGDALLPVPSGAPSLDDRFVITEEESARFLKNAFASTDPLTLDHLPVKEKKKFAVLARIAQEFEPGQDYTEKQVNAILKAIYPDYVTLRRYLIEYGFLSRTANGARYWVK